MHNAILYFLQEKLVNLEQIFVFFVEQKEENACMYTGIGCAFEVTLTFEFDHVENFFFFTRDSIMLLQATCTFNEDR